MTTQFRVLLTIRIDHGYYEEGSHDFDFIIPDDTAQLLRNGKMLSKVRDGVFYLFFEADETGVALASSAGKRLRFGLKLLNPFFSNITDLDFNDLGFHFNEATPLYQNATDISALDPAKEAVLVGALFSHLLTKVDRPVTVTLKDRTGQSLQAETVTVTDRTSVPFDLTGRDSGVYTVEETYPSDTVSTLYYADAALLQEGIFGVIEMDINGSFYTTAPDFKVTFKAKEETLKYYLVAKNYSDAELNQLSVSDVGFTTDKRPEVGFDKVSSLTADEKKTSESLLSGKSGDKKLILFKSTAKVARQEGARKNIQLTKNDVVLVTNLPQPGIDRSHSDLYVHVSKP